MARGGLSATRALEFVDFMASQGTRPYSLSELSRELGVNVASTHSILQSLTKSGHLSRHPKHKTYTLGPALVAIGHIALRNHELIRAAEAAAADFSRRERVEVLLSMQAGDTVLGLANFKFDGLSKSWLRTGQRLPLQMPYGATFVAWGLPEEIDAWIARGLPDDAAPGMVERLKGIVSFIRERGYQVSLRSSARHEATGDWEAGRYVEQAAQRMKQVESDLDLLAFDPRTAEDDASYWVEFITAPLFDPHNKALYAITLFDFDRALTGREIRHRLSGLLDMCAAIGREH